MKLSLRVLLLMCLGPGLALAQSTAASGDSVSRPKRGLSATLERAAQERTRQRNNSRYDNYFRKYSKRYFGLGFDWRYFKAQGMAESQLNPNAKSYVGARGIMQLMPTTFQEIHTARPEFKAIDDPEWNIAAGILHDRYLWTLWTKGVEEAERPAFMFGSYNAGEGTITRACGVARASQLDFSRWSNIEHVAPQVQRWRYRETIGYVRKIQDNYSRLSNQQ
jgi:soluble lytic murein transglycosylase-like protein